MGDRGDGEPGVFGFLTAEGQRSRGRRDWGEFRVWEEGEQGGGGWFGDAGMKKVAGKHYLLMKWAGSNKRCGIFWGVGLRGDCGIFRKRLDILRRQLGLGAEIGKVRGCVFFGQSRRVLGSICCWN